jgi:hypothetical protein
MTERMFSLVSKKFRKYSKLDYFLRFAKSKWLNIFLIKVNKEPYYMEIFQQDMKQPMVLIL